MRKIIISLILCLLFILPSLADNIFLKNGTKIINVKILEQDGKWIYYQMSNGQKTKVSRKAVLIVENAPFNPQQESKIIAPNFKDIVTQSEYKKEHYPNFKLITLSVISFALSYDYFKQASDIQKSIDFNEFLSKNYSDDQLIKNYRDIINNLKNKKSRKELLGAIFLTSGIINAIISFKSVQIKASPQSVSLSYKF